LGFNSDLAPAMTPEESAQQLSKVVPTDLLKFGLIPEFIGRLPVIAAVNKLDKAALVSILTEPKNALTKQYARLFELDDVELEFTMEACEAMADLALERDTGARGLRSIVEDALQEIMYEIPSRDDVAKVIVTAGAVHNTEPPTVLTHDEVNKKAS
jgi:ATP-dependent Clp protease ATP-binding subunit ClpX